MTMEKHKKKERPNLPPLVEHTFNMPGKWTIKMRFLVQH